MPVFETTDGQQIAYHDSGERSSLAPIFFLHSFGHNRNMWFAQLNHYRHQGYRVIAPDMPGHGHSTFDASTLSIDGIGETYTQLLDALQVPRVILAGISIGGYIALCMWRKRPEQIAALVLCCTKAEADSEEIRGRRRAQIENLHKNGLANFIETGAPKRLSPDTVAERPWVLDWIKMMNYTVSAEANAATLEAMAAKPDDTTTLATIDVPTLVLAGADDIFIPKDAPVRLREGIPNAVFHEIANAGHVAVLEQPNIVNCHMDDFLRTPPAAAGSST